MGLGAAGSFVFVDFTLTTSLVTFEVTRIDGVGLDWRSRGLKNVEGFRTCDATPGKRGDDGAVRDAPATVCFGGCSVMLALR